MTPTRRQLLGGFAAVGAGAAAGCLDGSVPAIGDNDGEGAYTAFFTLENFTENVTGDAMSVANPIPAGEMGHHYEVGTDVQVEVARSRVFVYLGIDGFQRWALDAATNVRNNDANVVLVDALDGIELLDFDGHGHDHHDNDHHDDHDGHDHDDHDHHDDHHDHDDHDDDHHDDDHHDDDHHDDDHHDDDHHDDDHHDDDHDDHDHGDYDPHYWLDPLLAAQSVQRIVDGLADADPENGDTYQANAAEYVAELEALHETFVAELAGRTLDTVVVAGHDSYQYLAYRYDFDVHSPVGVSPNAEPSASEIVETIDLVDDRGIDVILYDAFESPTLAETIVAESNAERVIEITPIEGTTPEWTDKGWGYVDQMKEINLPALKAALNVE